MLAPRALDRCRSSASAKAHDRRTVLFRSAEALLPPHECGGSHHGRVSLLLNILDHVGAVASRFGVERGAITHARQRGVAPERGSPGYSG